LDKKYYSLLYSNKRPEIQLKDCKIWWSFDKSCIWLIF